jgi:predicted aspartyl protease
LKKSVSFEIDTGFSETVLMPIHYIELLDIHIQSEEYLSQANGELLLCMTGSVDFSWFGKHRRTKIYFSDTESCLLGRRFLEQTILTINFDDQFCTQTSLDYPRSNDASLNITHGKNQRIKRHATRLQRDFQKNPAD